MNLENEPYLSFKTIACNWSKEISGNAGAFDSDGIMDRFAKSFWRGEFEGNDAVATVYYSYGPDGAAEGMDDTFYFEGDEENLQSFDSNTKKVGRRDGRTGIVRNGVLNTMTREGMARWLPIRGKYSEKLFNDYEYRNWSDYDDDELARIFIGRLVFAKADFAKWCADKNCAPPVFWFGEPDNPVGTQQQQTIDALLALDRQYAEQSHEREMLASEQIRELELEAIKRDYEFRKAKIETDGEVEASKHRADKDAEVSKYKADLELAVSLGEDEKSLPVTEDSKDVVEPLT